MVVEVWGGGRKDPGHTTQQTFMLEPCQKQHQGRLGLGLGKHSTRPSTSRPAHPCVFPGCECCRLAAGGLRVGRNGAGEEESFAYINSFSHTLGLSSPELLFNLRCTSHGSCKRI